MAAQRLFDVPRYLVEWYRPGLGEELLEETAQRLDHVARDVTADGHLIDLLLTLFMPRDEVAFCLFAAESAEAVTRVCHRAALPYDRIAEALEVDPPGGRPGRTLRHSGQPHDARDSWERSS